MVQGIGLRVQGSGSRVKGFRYKKGDAIFNPLNEQLTYYACDAGAPPDCGRIAWAPGAPASPSRARLPSCCLPCLASVRVLCTRCRQWEGGGKGTWHLSSKIVAPAPFYSAKRHAMPMPLASFFGSNPDASPILISTSKKGVEAIPAHYERRPQLRTGYSVCATGPSDGTRAWLTSGASEPRRGKEP